MLNMKRKQKIILIIFVAVISLMGCNKQTDRVEYEKSLTEFEAIVNNIMDNFTYDGYEEIMKTKSVVLALPMEYEKVDEAIDYLALQKLLVYKNVERDVIILLQITKSQDAENSWNHSLSYSPAEYNSQEKGTAIDISDVEVGAYSFTYEGYNYMSVGLSDSKPEEFQLAATELVGFNNVLITFITGDAAE